MRTPKKWEQLLAQKYITAEMLGACAYSCNKRAKNYRDAERKYHGRYARDSYRKKQEFYSMKDKLLHTQKPIAVHRSVNDYGYEHFFAYYEVGGYKFHKPIDNPSVLPDLPVIDIGNFETHGADYNDLVSVEFCKKVLALIEGGEYVFTD